MTSAAARRTAAVTRAGSPAVRASPEPAACEEDADLGWSLPIATRAFLQWASDAVADLPGGRRGYLVLATISRDLPRSQLALAHQLGVDKTAMTYLLDELETAGLVERRPDPADRRARQVLITASGTTALKARTARLDTAAGKLLAPLSSREAAAFRAMLGRVARSVQTSPDGCSADSDPAPDCP
jgi:DNA-binding MarR family transcriptional regulator